jgi:hypothetical protein
MPMRANIVGPPISTTSISASIAASGTGHQGGDLPIGSMAPKFLSTDLPDGTHFSARIPTTYQTSIALPFSSTSIKNL